MYFIFKTIIYWEEYKGKPKSMYRESMVVQLFYELIEWNPAIRM